MGYDHRPHGAGATGRAPTGQGDPGRPVIIYSEEQISSLIGAADRLTPTIRGATFHTLIALMAATGLRTGEAIGLDIANLDQKVGTLTVTGKYGKIRMLPLHPTVLHGLTRYLEQRDQLLPAPTCPALLISTRGRRLPPGTVHYTFRHLVRQSGLGPVSSACRPRLHDLRHTFAVATMLDAYRSGADPAVTLPILSTWLGHARPGDTYWYLTGTPRNCWSPPPTDCNTAMKTVKESRHEPVGAHTAGLLQP